MDKTTAAASNLAATGPGVPTSMASGTLVAAAVAVALAWASPGAHAAALGAVTVQSALGEPLRAEIQIPQLSSEEASTFSARMGSPSAFAGAGISYNTDLSGAVVSLQRRSNGDAYLRITTSRPINEPVLGIVIEADWASGQVTRDYTMLLDPPKRTEPEAASPQVTAVTAPAPARVAAAPTPQTPRVGQAEQVRSSPAPSTQKKSTAPDVNHTPGRRAPDAAVTIRRGDTASQIAVAHGLQGVSLDQMLLAMLRANPQAFIQGNVNLIRAGAVIQMPSAEDARSVSRADARRTVLAQTEDFQAYRRGLAQNVQATQATPGSQAAEGQVEPQVAETQKPPADDDRLEISKGGADAETATQAAQSRQSQEQTERVAELDRNISELSELERQLTDAPAAADDAAASSPDAGSATGADGEDTAASSTDSEPATEVDGEDANGSPTPADTDDATAATGGDAADPDAADPDANDTEQPVAEDDEGAAAADDGGASDTETEAADGDAGTPQPEAESASADAAAPAADADRSGLAIPAALPAEQPASLLDRIAEYRWPIVAILVALLALFGIGRARGRKREESTADEGPTGGRPFVKTAMKPGDVATPDDAGNRESRAVTPEPESPAADESDMSEEALSSDFVDTAFPLTATEAEADSDLVKEADIYIEYGHDEKAEELLDQALRSEPGRIEIYQKLAQLYQRRNDGEALAMLSARAAVAPEHAEAAWQAVAAVGRELEPDNPRYRVGTPGGVPEAPAVPAPSGNAGGAPRTAPDAPFNHQMFWAETEKGGSEFLDDDAQAEDNRYSPTTLDFDLNFDESEIGERKAVAPAPLDPARPDLEQPDPTQAPVERTPGTHEESLDLDIDFSAPGQAGGPVDSTDAGDDAEPRPDYHSALMEFDLTAESAPEEQPMSDSAFMAFNLEAKPAPEIPAAADSTLMDFDLDADSTSEPPPAADSTLMDFDLGHPTTGADEHAMADGKEDPLATKLALAEEFEAIGDKEGARSMAREVADTATGALKERAEAFLNKLDSAQ